LATFATAAIGRSPYNSIRERIVMVGLQNSYKIAMAVSMFAVLVVALAFRSSAGDPPVAVQLPNTSDPRFDYHDDRDGRNLAEVDLKLADQTGDADPSLNIRISAVGPDVDPIPGYRGVKGANRYTAEELDLMLSGKHTVEIQTWQPGALTPIDGSIHAGRRGHIPQRRVMSNGRIDVLAMTRSKYALDLTINTGALKRGAHHTEVVIDDIPRMRVSFDFDGRQAYITGFESLGDPDHVPVEPLNEAQILAAGDAKGTAPKKPVVHPAPVTDAEWDMRDLEGKWVLFKEKSKNEGFKSAAWIQYLEKRKDYEFLEWIGLYQIDAMKMFGVGWSLAKADAPQWIRAAAWSRRAPQMMGHGEAQARSILRTHNPALAYSWLDKYKDTFIKTSGPTKRDYVYLQNRKLKLQDLGKVLPPLKVTEVFKHLDPPATLEQFGNRKKAAADTVYEHQVLRAIDGMVASGYYEEPWIGKVIKLTQHKNEKVRQSAYLSISHFANKIDKKRYPLASFEKTIDDKNESAAVRESALMVYTYFDHPAIFAKLHGVALDTEHPGWPTAISRLGDQASEFSLKYLAILSEKELSDRNAEIWATSFTRIQGRLEKQKTKPVTLNQKTIAMHLERAAWAEHTNDPISSKLTEWTVKTLGVQLTESTVGYALKVRKDYEPQWTTGEEKAIIQKRVRELADDLVKEWDNK
jgi:hypothetical protein